MKQNFDKTQFTKEQIHFLICVISCLLKRPAIELDVRSIMKECGVIGIAQKELTTTLQEARENFDGSPLGIIIRLAPLVPAEIVSAAAAMMDTYFQSKINDKYVADTAAHADLQAKLTESLTSATKMEALVAALHNERSELKSSLDAANNNLAEQLERYKVLELEKATCEGRLHEREATVTSGPRKPGRKPKNAPTGPKATPPVK